MYRSRNSIHNARKLRHDATDVETRLWSALRSSQLDGIKFRRQHPIGPYIADFCAPSLALLIELDGGQHAERQEEDLVRSRYLESQGYRVLRFWNNDVNDAFDSVLEKILLEIQRLRSIRR